MRPDMAKVIVERPRPPSRVPRGRDGRHFRDASDAAFLPMKAGYRDLKSLNENLRPLVRYLQRQVNRPWDCVYREIRVAIDGRNAVQRHILEHLSQFVAMHTRVVDGKLIDVSARIWGLRGVWQPLYVHPRTGLLRRNDDDISWRVRYRESIEAETIERARVWRAVSPALQLHRINNVWYEVEIGALPTSPATVWDAVRRCSVTQGPNFARRRLEDAEAKVRYGRPAVYAVSKRQLSSREIRAYRLENP